MDKIKILVAQHKEAKVYANDVYIPIQVGKALSQIDLGIQGDNTGDNISDLNPFYCELTAQYWAWKNLSDVEYIGLCHYRRYFHKEFTAFNIDEEMKNYDIILTKRGMLEMNVLEWYSAKLIPEDIAIFYLYMTYKYRDKISVFKQFYECHNWLNFTNMFVCRKSLFDHFSSWQFEILEDLRSIIPVSPYAREQRLMGYLAETLLPFYTFEQRLRVKELSIVPMLGKQVEGGEERALYRFWRLCKNKISFKKYNREFIIPDYIMVGLQKDGIIEKIDALFAAKNNY